MSSAARIALALAVVGLAVPVAGPPREASAYACYEARIQVWPSGEGAPTNTRVRLRFPAPEARVLRFGPGRQILEEATVVPLTAVFVIVGPDGASVPMQRHIVDGTDLPWVELVPAEPLAPRAAYRVVVRKRGRDFEVGDFVTGDGPIGAAPAAPVIAGARYVRLARVAYKETGGPYVRVRFRAPKTEPATPSPVLYEVHFLDPQGTIGPSTLRAVVPGTARGLVFGKTSLCEPQEVVFPANGTLRFALRPIDAAGHAGPAVEATVDLDHPATVDSDRR